MLALFSSQALDGTASGSRSVWCLLAPHFIRLQGPSPDAKGERGKVRALTGSRRGEWGKPGIISQE